MDLVGLLLILDLGFAPQEFGAASREFFLELLDQELQLVVGCEPRGGLGVVGLDEFIKPLVVIHGPPHELLGGIK